MDFSDPDRHAFAEAWLAEQRRLWEAFRAQPDASAYSEVREGWTRACERWWSAMAESSPESLKPALDAALEHTRLCLELGVQLAEGRDVSRVGSWLLSPERLFHAAASALGSSRLAAADPSDAAQVQAMADAMKLLSAIVQTTLAAVRERVESRTPDSPADLLEIYFNEFEGCYLAAADSDEFARIAGDLVNTWVDAEARRQSRRT